MSTVQRVKVTAGSWAGQEGEFVREDEDGKIVARMAAGRLVEFSPDVVEAVKPDESEAVEPDAAE